MIDLSSGKGTYWFLGGMFLLFFTMFSFGLYLAIKQEMHFKEQCEAKGGDWASTKSGMICINKDVLIKV